MKFNRRNFIKSTSIITAGLFLPTNKLLYALQSENGNIQTLRNNIGIFTERGGTIGWLVSDDAVIVIDAQFPNTAEHFITKLHDKTNRKIDFLINTHHHHDHTSGNVTLKKYTNDIVANENAVELQKKFYGSGDTADSQVYANITFTDMWSANIGNEKVTAKHYWNAHTGGDSFIHFENSNVVHLGDLVFNRVYPYMDRPAGTNIESWAKYLEKVIGKFDSDTIFIYGHGSSVYGKKDDLVRMKNYLLALLEYVKKNIGSDKSKEEIISMGPIPGFEDQVEAWPGALKMSLTAAYEELST